MRHSRVVVGLFLAVGWAACSGGGEGNGGRDVLIPGDSVASDRVEAGADPAGIDEETPPDIPGQRDLPVLDLPGADCGVTEADYFDRLVDALAGFYARCSPGDRINFWQNPRNTRWMLEGRIRPMQAEYEARMAAGRLFLDREVACLYLGLLEKGECNATRTMRSGLYGRAGEGDACRLDEECPDSHFCRFPDTTTCDGTCAPRAGEGQLCDIGGCQPGYTCRLDDADEFRCVASYWIRQPGDACDPSTDVCARSFCDGSRCRELPQPGTSCSPGSYCRDGWCDRNLNLCKPYVGAGGACESWTSCEDGHYCLPFPDERCAPRLELGRTCDPKRNSFDFPGVSLACASGMCDKVQNVCTDTPPPSACD